MTSIVEAVRTLTAPDADAAGYLDYHRRRYEYLLSYIGRVLAGLTPIPGRRLRLLDVGMSHQTRLLREIFPEVELATLGFYDHRFQPMAGVAHTEFNLNDAANQAHWPAVEPVDCILLAEVLEHLHVPPSHTFRMLRALLRPGGMLLIQTPNPINLARRLALLGGKSPFEIIRDDATNPGHYCEYTVDNLIYLAENADMELLDFSVLNYFGRRKPLYNLACSLLPGHQAEGITILLRRPYS